MRSIWPARSRWEEQTAGPVTPHVPGNFSACARERFLSASEGGSCEGPSRHKQTESNTSTPLARGLVPFPPAPQEVVKTVTGSGGLCSFGVTGWGSEEAVAGERGAPVGDKSSR